MVDTRSNMQLADLNSKPHGGKNLRDLIECAIVPHLYPTPGSEHYIPLWLDQFYGTYHIINNQENNNKNRILKIFNAHKITKNTRVNKM